MTASAAVLLLAALAAWPSRTAGAQPGEGDPRYLARRTAEPAKALLSGASAGWEAAGRITWGPEATATSFRALWSDEGLAVRFDVTDDAPWHTLTAFDERLWTEEVVELFLDVGATGRSYAEFEWNPAGAVVDLWVDRADERFDRAWNAAGLSSRVVARRQNGRATGWTALAFLPWSALRERAPAGTALPPRPGERWRFNLFRIERPFGPAEPDRDPLFLAWSPTGEHSFHVPAAFREIEFSGELVACHEASRVSMGSTATVRACGPDRRRLVAGVAAALDEVDRVDRLLSHYRDSSPLTRLNRDAANGPVTVEPELFQVLALCARWSRASDGAFDATVGPLMKAWGFFRGDGRVPGEAELEQARRAVGYRHVILDPARGSVRFDRPGVELDLGGIGKGYAVDRAVELLRHRGVGSALVSLGGSSVYGLGVPPGESAWRVELQDPRDATRPAASVALADRALSVSAGHGRFFERDGVRYTHVMDPRSGRPVEGVLGVAVVSASAADGDALDNALFVLGLVAARALVARLPPEAAASVYYFLPDGDSVALERFATAAAERPPLPAATPRR